MDFVGRILRVVTTRVKEIPDVVRLENLEESIHVPGCLLRLLVEIDLVPAGTESRRRGVLEPLDGLGTLVAEVHQFLVEYAENSVESTQDVLDPIVTPCLGDDPRDARVDDRCRAAGLGDQQITVEFRHRDMR